MVESRLIYAPSGVYMGRPKIAYGSQAHMQSEGRFYTVGKSFIIVGLVLTIIGFQPMV